LLNAQNGHAARLEMIHQIAVALDVVVAGDGILSLAEDGRFTRRSGKARNV